MNCYLSVVVPIYNEEESIPNLYKELYDALNDYDKPFEVILVDDGSKDDSFNLLKEINEKDSRFRVIKFRKNFGQTPAMVAGFDHAKGEIIVTIDADLQNDPNDILSLIDVYEQGGYDIVSGWRKKRKDKALFRKFPSKIANRLISKSTGIKLKDYGCTLKVYNAKILKSVHLAGELHRFIPAVCSEMGIHYVEVPVNHRVREFGTSKYGISRTFRVILDLILVRFLLEYMHKPIQFFGKIAFYSLFLSFLSAVATIGMKLYLKMDITGNPFFLLTFILLILSINLVSTGVIAEMISRVYYSSDEKKAIYYVDQVL